MTNLRKIRTTKGITTTKLADKSGIPYRTLLHYETGERNIDGAKLDTIISIAMALNVDIRDILESNLLIDKLTLYIRQL